MKFLKLLVMSMMVSLFVQPLFAQPTPTPTTTTTGQSSPGGVVPAPFPLGPPIQGNYAAANITITAIEFYDPNTQTWAGATYANNVWNAPAGAANKNFRVVGTVTPATGGGVLPGSEVITNGILTNAGNIASFCDWFVPNNTGYDFEITYVEVNAGDLTPKRVVNTDYIYGFIKIEQSWTVNKLPKPYTTASINYTIKF